MSYGRRGGRTFTLLKVNLHRLDVGDFSENEGSPKSTAEDWGPCLGAELSYLETGGTKISQDVLQQ